jgi:hypothetical protein
MLVKILEKGTDAGDFVQIEIDATANMLIAMLNGLMRQQIVCMDGLKGVEQVTVDFCRMALIAKV